jgi:hypothetical protein
MALIAHLGYDIEAIGPFLTRWRPRRRFRGDPDGPSPSSIADLFCRRSTGELRCLSRAREFLDLLRVRGCRPEIVETSRPP